MKEVLLLLFLTAVLSDDTVSRDEPCRPTPPDITGPYYFPRPPRLLQYCTGDPERYSLDNLLVHGRVLKSNCRTPIPRVRIEVWQADHEGEYKFSTACRGFLHTDSKGYYEFTTIHPGRYTIDQQNRMFRPSHIHFRIFGRRGHKGLITQLYFAGDPYLGRNDSCTVCSSGNQDLIKRPQHMCEGNTCMDVVKFDIVLERGSGTSVTNEGPDDITE